MSAEEQVGDERAPTGARRRFTVRIVNGGTWVEGLAPPLGPRHDDWQGEGTFDLPASIGERIDALSVDVQGVTKGQARFVTYRAVFVSLHGGDA